MAAARKIPSHKPIVWGLFAAGGTVAAFIMPVLVMMLSFAIPLGLIPADALGYDALSDKLQHPLVRLIALGILMLLLWHAAHRLRITAHDLGIRADTLVAVLLYGMAAAGTLLLLASLIPL